MWHLYLCEPKYTTVNKCRPVNNSGQIFFFLLGFLLNIWSWIHPPESSSKGLIVKNLAKYKWHVFTISVAVNHRFSIFVMGLSKTTDFLKINVTIICNQCNIALAVSAVAPT